MENDSSLVRMYVDVDDRKKTLLTQQDVYEIEQYILEQICTNVEKQGHPQLRGHVFSEIEGALIIKSHVDSVSWLEKVIRSYQKKALRIRNLKDVPQYTAEVQASIPPSDSVLELLEAQNVGLVTSGWKFLSTSDTTLYNGRKGRCVTLFIDDPGREVQKEITSTCSWQFPQ